VNELINVDIDELQDLWSLQKSVVGIIKMVTTCIVGIKE